jgi:glycosyltransferase involved in cell wall biosynthesis
VIPAYNEARVLRESVRALDAHLRGCGWSYRITIVDNGSTDATRAKALTLACELASVRVMHLDERGRGRALRAAWSTSDADVLVYMDADLSTDLAALRDLVEPLLEGRGDLAIGTRLAPGAQVRRRLRHALISRIYNMVLRLALQTGISDAQCGFKAGRREVIQELLPAVEDEKWFFDTELLHAARRAAFSVREVPVRWVEHPNSRMRILATARADLRGIVRLRRAQREAARLSRSGVSQRPAPRRIRSASR